MAQFSKYVHTGAVRIGATASGNPTPDVMAFKNPDSSIVVIAHNAGSTAYNARVVVGTNQVEYASTAMSIDDLTWYPVGVSVVNSAKTPISAKAKLSAWRHVMGLQNGRQARPDDTRWMGNGFPNPLQAMLLQASMLTSQQ